MKEAIGNLLSSRKAIVTILVVVGVIVLAALGRLAAEPAMEFLKWIVIAWLGAQAYEDGAVKSAAIKAGVNTTAPADVGAGTEKPTANDP